jgi:nitronate monooxygenase
MAPQAYKEMLVSASMDDVLLTRAFTGLETNMLRPSIEAVGLDPKRLDEQMSEERANAQHGSGGRGPKRWSEVWSAGHTVSGVTGIVSVESLVAEVEKEYRASLVRR